MKNKRKLVILLLAIFILILGSKNLLAASVENVQLEGEGILNYTNNPFNPFYSTSKRDESHISNRISSLFNRVVAATLPSSYRTEGLTVKNQGETGECWAFAYTSAIEAYNLTHNGSTKIFSPRHIDYSCSKSFTESVDSSKYFNREVTDGAGNYFLASAYAASRKGPVLESDMPFSETLNKISINDLNKERQKQIEDYVIFDSVYKKYTGSQVSYYMDPTCTMPYNNIEGFRNQVKQQIKENGAVLTCIFQTVRDSDVLVKQDEYGVNHGVCIVGWNDTYQAAGWDKPGAYIAINSYTEESFYDGYIYISYDDIYVEENLFGITAVSDVDTTNVYEYDELGTTGGATGEDIAEECSQTEEITAVNVFNRESVGKDELLTEVGVANWSYQKAEVYFTEEFSSDSGDELPKNWKLIGSTDTMGPGFKTIRLSKPTKLTKDKYAIAVRFIEDNVEKQASVALEMPLSSNNWWANVKGNKGESFIVIDKFNTNGGNTFYMLGSRGNYYNNCVKGYTTISSDISSSVYEIRGSIVTKVDLNTSLEDFKSKITVPEGKEYKVVDSEGHEVSENDAVLKTGDKVVIDSKEYVISVRGDVTGDGVGDILDLARIRAHAVGRKGYILTGASLYAADLSSDSQVDILDIVRMRRICVE